MYDEPLGRIRPVSLMILIPVEADEVALAWLSRAR